MTRSNIKKTVYVAMSGGVDSSVAAALLVRQNYNVVGVFFKPWSPETESRITNHESRNSKIRHDSKFLIHNSCMWKEDREVAMKVASHLGIKFKTWDFSKEYGEKVVKYMVSTYRKGITPNPDVMCNKEIKFGLFLKKALAEGADFIATGHYVQKEESRITNHESRFELLKGKDSNKDQSYFLWTLTQKQLKYCLFPVGDLTKPEVRKLAKKFSLPNYDKKDSQGVCFVGQLDVKEFLKKYIKPKVGDIILLETGRKIGQHDGVYYYTIGQRHGLDIKIGGGPYFVAKKDIAKNIIYVTCDLKSQELAKKYAEVKNVNWLRNDLKFPLNCQVKIRYRNASNPATIKKIGNRYSIEFKKPVKAITSGQSAVFYKGDELLGGGVIL
jgi:tRNA-specific 2-thiouridylase